MNTVTAVAGIIAFGRRNKRIRPVREVVGPGLFLTAEHRVKCGGRSSHASSRFHGSNSAPRRLKSIIYRQRQREV